MNFKKWVKSKQTAGYNGARTVIMCVSLFMILPNLEAQAIMTVVLLVFWKNSSKCKLLLRFSDPLVLHPKVLIPKTNEKIVMISALASKMCQMKKKKKILELHIIK